MAEETSPSPECWSWLSPFDRLDLDIAAIRVEVEHQRAEIAELSKIIRAHAARQEED